MLLQLALGSALLIISILIGAFSALVMELVLTRWNDWLLRPPHRPKLMIAVAGVSLWVLGTITVAVWIWAFAFRLLHVFPTLEESVYFALVAFTTLGFGDVLPPHEWRLLGGMAAANGFLNFGLMTALLVEALRHVRLGQVDARRRH
ncbi:two pore domain potassium channel family protein [Gemmobacter lutimaris]|uniref:Two pore domain potassium channel family protein n=2 Tax=Gemmobacter lutimaris TaxID=2306023 RepID=A0A398C0I5_9RHOB|nr:two pore domain potassium channel family protein [Gemmobacter lutimaris]